MLLFQHKSSQENAQGAVHIPVTIGSVVVAYNLPSLPNKGLKLTGPIIADIFLGKIKKWNNTPNPVYKSWSIFTF